MVGNKVLSAVYPVAAPSERRAQRRAREPQLKKVSRRRWFREAARTSRNRDLRTKDEPNNEKIIRFTKIKCLPGPGLHPGQPLVKLWDLTTCRSVSTPATGDLADRVAQ